MSNPRRLLDHVTESQNLVLDAKTRSAFNTNMSDKHSEAQDTPFNVCMNGKELVLNSLPMKPLPSSQPSTKSWYSRSVSLPKLRKFE